MPSSRDHKFSTAYCVHTLLHIRRKFVLSVWLRFRAADKNGKARWGRTEARRTACRRPCVWPSARTGGGLKPAAAHSECRDHAPDSDEHRRRSSARVAARWRTNAMQSLSALLACGAGHSDQGNRRGGPCTGLFARRRPRKPLNQTVPSANAAASKPAWRCAPAGGRVCRQRHAPRSIVSIPEALAATVARRLQAAASLRPSSRRPARTKTPCPLYSYSAVLRPQPIFTRDSLRPACVNQRRLRIYPQGSYPLRRLSPLASSHGRTRGRGTSCTLAVSRRRLAADTGTARFGHAGGGRRWQRRLGARRLHRADPEAIRRAAQGCRGAQG